jgi:hypothetical protein
MSTQSTASSPSESQQQSDGHTAAGKPTWFLGAQPVPPAPVSPEGEFLDLPAGRMYVIRHVDGMPPFLMSINSASDRWMFASSTGGLTAGTRNPDHALFPYTTDDRLHEAGTHTGSHSLLQVERDGHCCIWEPFAEHSPYRVERNVYKNRAGNLVEFEERNEDLECTFRYAWAPSDRLGFIKRSAIWNFGKNPVHVRMVDGLRNLVPADSDPLLLAGRSNLLDAYKKAERVQDDLALFRLNAIPVDRAEPSESLRATMVWTAGFLPDLDPAQGVQGSMCLLSENQLDRFRRGNSVEIERDIRGRRSTCYAQLNMTLSAGQAEHWYMVAEQEQGASELAACRKRLLEHHSPEGQQRLMADIEAAIEEETEAIDRWVGMADGLQVERDELVITRHYANVQYNIMRGGLPLMSYRIPTANFRRYLMRQNKPLAERYEAEVLSWPERMLLPELLEAVDRFGDVELRRLAGEYLPFGFSRRHGDPSRPWNRFSIELKAEEGGLRLAYEGNWRDIFQNWETLGFSWPEFFPAMIDRFLNASTLDGYNPYRVTSDGLDWEVEDPEDPWSYIGYWGDHQIVYLTRLLEADSRFHPGRLSTQLGEKHGVFADVPYRIAGYADLLRDPKNTVSYDHAAAARSEERTEALGADGKLVASPEGGLLYTSMAEKLLLPLCVKASNLVPGGGIWLNTQRPEWNDANNALVGQGLSMVTTAQMRRHTVVLKDIVAHGPEQVEATEAFLNLLRGLTQKLPLASGEATRDAQARRRAMDALGALGEAHREAVYAYIDPERAKAALRFGTIDRSEMMAFLEVLLKVLDETLMTAKRSDGLYHAYNRMALQSDGGVTVEHYYAMLEGQMAMLSSGMLGFEEAIACLDALRNSPLYREDQRSYLLYPDRELARFMEANQIPEDRVQASALLQNLVAAAQAEPERRALVERDAEGTVRFAPRFRNAADLLEACAEEALAEAECAELAEHWEAVFQHAEFTGRSGTFFGYEGLGSIYWHMVSKLMLAVQELWEAAVAEHGADDARSKALEAHYRAIRSGIGWEHDPETYGAFPTDPYSHTPASRGAQQPGMTGQVKEDILCRLAELGVTVEDAQIGFGPGLLRASDYLKESAPFRYLDVEGRFREWPLEVGQLAFTVCGVPVRYHRSDKTGLRVHYADGEVFEGEGLRLSTKDSQSMFAREGKVELVDVFLPLA